MADMGLGKLGLKSLVFKRKFRWLFQVSVQGNIIGTDALPPWKGSRPNLTFKEVPAQHLNETIYYPMKPDWKPINVTVYDTECRNNPIFNWIKRIYDPSSGTWVGPAQNRFIETARLLLLDGCGNQMENWTFENVWPQAIDFGELDMESSEVVVVDITLRYARAYLN